MVDARGRARARGRVARNPKLRIRQISRERGSVGIPVRQRSSRVVDVHLAALDGPRGPGLEVPGDESANLVVRSPLLVFLQSRGYRLHARRTSPATCGGLMGVSTKSLESDHIPARCTAASSSPVQYRSVSPTNDASFIASEERTRGAKWRGDSARPRENNDLENNDVSRKATTAFWASRHFTMPPRTNAKKAKAEANAEDKANAKIQAEADDTMPSLTWTRASPRPSMRRDLRRETKGRVVHARVAGSHIRGRIFGCQRR